MLQQQLQQLLETLSSTEPHYIRRVKPNNLLKQAIFENQNVLQQLRRGVSKNNILLKYPGCMAQMLSRVQISTMTVKDNLMVPGGFQGKLICKYIDQPGVASCTKIATDENAITKVEFKKFSLFSFFVLIVCLCFKNMYVNIGCVFFVLKHFKMSLLNLCC
ncbi:hypothetical protein ACJIZ3_014347 [Penstemon smallii]|uniref:Uncharacterized protein n=1 Tax=Penstemon smallii TaxID=265156 RepID=A0ABD3RJE2_9LAMI